MTINPLSAYVVLAALAILGTAHAWAAISLTLAARRHVEEPEVIRVTRWQIISAAAFDFACTCVAVVGMLVWVL